MPRSLLVASAAAAALAFLPAAAFDCAKAASRPEKAICADPKLKAADDAMNAAYEAVKAAVSAEQKTALQADQAAWLITRTDSCEGSEAGAYPTCLLETTGARTAFLTATPGSGPGLGVKPLPFFIVRKMSKSECSAAVAVYKFGPSASGAGEKAHDAWATKLVDGFEETYGARDQDLPEDVPCDYEAGATLNYASPEFLSSTISYYAYGGGAHGGGDSESIQLDMKTGKALAFGDVFDANGAKILTDACTAEIKAAKLDRLTMDDTPSGRAEAEKQVEEDLKMYGEAIGEGVRNFSRWSITADNATVYFASYTLGSYAEGPYDCTFTKDELAKASGPKGWLVH